MGEGLGSTPRKTVADYYDDEEFDEILTRAAKYAETQREMEFARSMRERWEEFGPSMFVSERQLDWLYNIASYR